MHIFSLVAIFSKYPPQLASVEGEGERGGERERERERGSEGAKTLIIVCASVLVLFDCSFSFLRP